MEGLRVAEQVATVKPPRTQRAKWLRRLAAAGVVYLLCWAVTWAFAPAALNRWWAAHHSRTGSDIRGNAEPVEFRTGVPFKGEGSDYRPDFTPKANWWYCIGRPWCPAPFIVASEVAWVDGELPAFAGEVWFIWTPFGMVPVYER
jgi:hypothetical protein